jgi:hypothetical protein
MKKLFFIFVLLSCLAAGFAETGYDGLQWGTKSNNITFPEIAKNTKAREKKMVGVNTVIFYHLIADQLKGVSYSVPAGKTDLLKSKYNSLLGILKRPVITQEKWSDILKKENRLSQKFTSEEIDRESNKVIFEYARDIVEKNYYDIDRGDARIYIYDYNADTIAFLFENFVEGVTFVVYTQYEQDY